MTMSTNNGPSTSTATTTTSTASNDKSPSLASRSDGMSGIALAEETRLKSIKNKNQQTINEDGSYGDKPELGPITDEDPTGKAGWSPLDHIKYSLGGIGGVAGLEAFSAGSSAEMTKFSADSGKSAVEQQTTGRKKAAGFAIAGSALTGVMAGAGLYQTFKPGAEINTLTDKKGKLNEYKSQFDDLTKNPESNKIMNARPEGSPAPTTDINATPDFDKRFEAQINASSLDNPAFYDKGNPGWIQDNLTGSTQGKITGMNPATSGNPTSMGENLQFQKGYGTQGKEYRDTVNSKLSKQGAEKYDQRTAEGKLEYDAFIGEGRLAKADPNKAANLDKPMTLEEHTALQKDVIDQRNARNKDPRHVNPYRDLSSNNLGLVTPEELQQARRINAGVPADASPRELSALQKGAKAQDKIQTETTKEMRTEKSKEWQKGIDSIESDIAHKRSQRNTLGHGITAIANASGQGLQSTGTLIDQAYQMEGAILDHAKTMFDAASRAMGSNISTLSEQRRALVTSGKELEVRG